MKRLLIFGALVVASFGLAPGRLPPARPSARQQVRRRCSPTTTSGSRRPHGVAARIDVPLLGRYSSDDERVMLPARALGQGGRHRRLPRELEVDTGARRPPRAAHQGGGRGALPPRDRLRGPRLPSQAAARSRRCGTISRASLRHLRTDRAFAVFERPLVIWSGTWRYTNAQIRLRRGTSADGCSCSRRPRMSTTTSASHPLVDGDAYYWSSVNPRRYTTFGAKLRSLGAAIHARGGLWIAPAAPGFDARRVGGSSVVGREDGDDAAPRAERRRVSPRPMRSE